MQTKSGNNDKALFIQLGKGSQRALTDVCERFFSPLVNFILRFGLNREIAKEIAMDVLEILWEQKDAVAAMEKPRSWLFRCAYNCALRYLQASRKTGIIIPLKDDSNLPAAGAMEGGLDAKELSGRIALAIDQLPPQQKTIIQLKLDYGLTRKEIARELHISESSVKNQITEAHKKLRKIMENISKYYLLTTLICLLTVHY